MSAVCRICLEREPRGSLHSYCNCKSDGKWIQEHEECVMPSLQALYKRRGCSICGCSYMASTRYSFRRLCGCAFQYAWQPVLFLLFLKLVLLVLQPQLQHSPSSPYWDLFQYLLLQFILLVCKLVDDLKLCSTKQEKELVISVLLLHVPCFLVLEWIECSLLRILPGLHAGFVLLYTRYNIKANLYQFYPLPKH